MNELKHGWVDQGTSAQRYCVEAPIGGTMKEVGNLFGASPGDDIQLKRTGEDTIELRNASDGNWWAFKWDINSWIMTDSR